MANMLQKLALKVAEKLISVVQKKVFGKEDALIYTRARLIVELDRVAIKAARDREALEQEILKTRDLNRELERQLEIMSWSSMSPTDAAAARKAFYKKEGVSLDEEPEAALVLQFPKKTQ